jgi:hypothetical protein
LVAYAVTVNDTEPKKVGVVVSVIHSTWISSIFTIGWWYYQRLSETQAPLSNFDQEIKRCNYVGCDRHHSWSYGVSCLERKCVLLKSLALTFFSARL